MLRLSDVTRTTRRPHQARLRRRREAPAGVPGAGREGMAEGGVGAAEPEQACRRRHARGGGGAAARV